MNVLAAPLFDPETWRAVPFHFWTVVFAALGAIVGSFLNVCIHRMPRDESIIRPPSRCPHCGTRLRWSQNLPIVSWLALRGKCATCAGPISPRYVIVETLTAGVFATLWVVHGDAGVLTTLSLCLFAGALIVATFIDFEHLIIPDEITLGGAAAGIVLAVIAPGIHGETYVWPALKTALIGAAFGAGLVFALVELGKLFLGRQRLLLEAGTRLVFTESEMHLPDRVLPYDEVFYRVSDALIFHAARLELVDRCYRNATVRLRLRAGEMQIGDEILDPSTVPWMEAETDEVTVPREAMGLGDVKFMAAIGAFTGWEGVLFSLGAGSVGGLLVTIVLTVLGRREWSARIPYGPYLAGAAMIWILGAREGVLHWLHPGLR